MSFHLLHNVLKRQPVTPGLDWCNQVTEQPIIVRRQRREQDRLLFALGDHVVRVKVTFQLLRKQLEVVPDEEGHLSVRGNSIVNHSRRQV